MEWIVYDPNEYATNGMIEPFDLRANGGPNNVWIAECGRVAEWGSFTAFREAIAASFRDSFLFICLCFLLAMGPMLYLLSRYRRLKTSGE